jgi:hypothetical protein
MDLTPELFANSIDDYSRDLRLAKWGPIIILRGNNRQDRMSALGQKRTSRPVE